MSTPYHDLIKKVLAWSNRDAAVFGITEEPSIYTKMNAGLLGDFVQYAADKSYRSLRVPSLEISRTFEVTQDDYEDTPANSGVTTINIPVPQDLIDVIYIRNKTDGYTFDEKVDLRTFYNNCSEKVSRTFWTRDGNTFKVAGVRLNARIELADQVGEPGDDDFMAAVTEEEDGTMLEIHYYRRLPGLNASYIVNAATYNIESSVYTYNTNATADVTTPDLTSVEELLTADDYLWFASTDTLFATAFDEAPETGYIGRHYTSASDMPITAEVFASDGSDLTYDSTGFPDLTSVEELLLADDYLWFAADDTAFVTAFDVAPASGYTGRHYDGNETDHWLRDENERIVLFGALAEAFAYLAEDDQAAKYLQIWQTEIDELNREETMRQGKGGNIKINYDGFGMI